MDTPKFGYTFSMERLIHFYLMHTKIQSISQNSSNQGCRITEVRISEGILYPVESAYCSLLVYAVCLSYLSVHVMVVAVPGSHFFRTRKAICPLN